MGARDERLDYLKGLAIALVLGSHLMPISFLSAGSRATFLASGVILTYQYFLSTLGVPVFFMVSSALYFARPQLKKRLVRLAMLFAFWVAVQYGVWAAANRAWPSGSLWTLRLGGPSLVGAEATVFYYLFNAIALLSLAACLSWVSSRNPRWGRFGAQAMIGVSLLTFWVLLVMRIRLPLWSVANFLPYVAFPHLLREGGRTPSWQGAALLGVLSAVAEGAVCWLLNGAVFTLPNYARGSTVFCALALYLLVMGSRRLPLRVAVAWLGRFSLGFYALHTFVQYGLRFVVPVPTVHVLGARVEVSILVSLATLAATTALVLLLSRSPLRRLVS